MTMKNENEIVSRRGFLATAAAACTAGTTFGPSRASCSTGPSCRSGRPRRFT
ncbi:MAG: twin-arginine translocation signal domain-containing protein, partial [Planctomycetes bacterium]|nr:twin-arginine translocation signal domain-containing protein [Planctomycetota bacterium]